MKRIKLTQNKYALVDNEDFEWLNSFKWIAEKAGNTWYVSRSGYTKGQKKRLNGKSVAMIRMHRMIMGFPKGKLIDHIDGNGLNNQRKNIRIADKSINKINSSKTKNKSGYRGVFPNKKKWLSRLVINNKAIYLGLFTNPKEAAIAYNNAAIKYHKEFANLNKI